MVRKTMRLGSVLCSLALLGCASTVATSPLDGSARDATTDPVDTADAVDATTERPIDTPVASDQSPADVTNEDVTNEDVANDRPAPTTPRPLAPLSGSRVTGGRPTLRWRRDADATGAWVEVSRDREGLRVVEQRVVAGDSTRPSVDAGELPPGVYFWRLRSVRGGSTGPTPSATWQFTVPARSGGADTAWGVQPDLDGDGATDLIDVREAEGDAVPGLVRFYRGPIGARRLVVDREIVSTHAYSARPVGDIDGDGYVDLAIRRTCSDGGATDRVDIHRGGATGPSLTPDFSIRWSGDTCVTARDMVGAGDVNGDGYGDLVVESPATRGFMSRCEVYFGAPAGPSAAADEMLEGGTEYTGFGRPIAVGDVNGDGFADVAFTDSSGYVHGDPDALIASRVRVYLGSARGLTASPPVVLASPLTRDPRFGGVIDGPIDVNGDGLADVLVDAPRGSDARDPATRRVYVFAGAADFSARAPSSTHEPRPGDDRFSGGSFASGGDVDGDGFDDLVLALDVRTGVMVQVTRGGAAGLSITPSQSFVRAGASVIAESASAWSDINSDGRADLVLPVWLPGGGAPATGRGLDVFWGRALPLDETPQSLL